MISGANEDEGDNTQDSEPEEPSTGSGEEIIQVFTEEHLIFFPYVRLFNSNLYSTRNTCNFKPPFVAHDRASTVMSNIPVYRLTLIKKKKKKMLKISNSAIPAFND